MSYATARRVLTGLASLIWLTMLAPAAMAGLGLGEARVQSYLGQPLDVRISLLQPSPAALESLGVEIATLEDHGRLGVPSDALALGLTVELDRSVEPPVIRIRSNRPATDPFVQLLINARWSSGRLLREYTLFLDPPTVPVAPPVRRAEIPSERAAPVAPEPRPEPAPEPPPVSAPAERPPTQTEPPSEARSEVQARPASVVGPVESGQTLWSIAAAWRPDESLTMNQVMLAIFDQNPDAFMGNNVNRLRRGAELRMPSPEAIRALAPAEATRRMIRQNEEWEAARRGSVAVPVVADARLPEPQPVPERPAPVEAEPPAAAGDEPDGGSGQAAIEAEPEGRLELTPPDEEAMVDLEALGAEREQLDARLETLSGELRADPVFNEDIATSLDQIRQAIDSADAGGLMLASEDLAVLESQLRDARQARAAEEARQLTAPPVEQPSAPALDPVAATPASGLVQRWLWPAVFGLLAIVLLVVALIWLGRRRRNALEAEASPVPPVSRKQSLPEEPMARLRHLAETEQRAAFGSALSEFHETVSGPTDPRWLEALAMGRILVPRHPLVLAAQEVEPEEDDSARALREILDSEVGEADLELDDAEFGFGDAPAQSSRAADSDEQADIARMTNRLDPEERSELQGDRIELADDEFAGLFTPSEPVRDEQLEPDADEPLSLDFEFSGLAEDASATEDEPVAEQTAEEEIREEEAEPDPQAEPDAEGDAESQMPFKAEVDQADAGEDFKDVDDSWFTVEDETETAEADLSEDESMADEAPAESLLSDDDAEVKMDLARAYLSMDDPDSARALLEEIIADGSESQQATAQALLDELK